MASVLGFHHLPSVVFWVVTPSVFSETQKSTGVGG